MAQTAAIDKATRDKLVEKLKSDPSFREQMKSDWPAAFRSVGIDPATVKGKVVDHSETTPFQGGAAMAGIHITIHIFAAAGMERVDVSDAVTFDERLTR